MSAFVEFEKSVERAVCMFVSAAITTVLLLWAADARSALQEAMAASAADRAAAAVVNVAHGSSSQEV